MPTTRTQRRKEDRPKEITAAAVAAFAENGYAGTRIEEVAQRAGISKGLLYLYFKTKEDLFKSVVRSFVVPRIDALTASISNADVSAEQILRGPILDLLKSVPGSPVGIVVRLMISEGAKHPDLVKFYKDNVVSRGISALQAIVDRGVASGEFRRTEISDMPHLLVQPAIFSLVFTSIFGKQSLDTDKLIQAHIEIVIEHLKNTKGTTR